MNTEALIKLGLTPDKIYADVCRRSFFHFVKDFWGEIINEVPVWNWHIEKLCGVLQGIGERVKARLPAEYEYVVINLPPGSSKSTIISIMYPMWCWTIDATQRFICTSYAGDISVDLADRSRRIFWSDKYRRYFPELLIDVENEAKSNFRNTLGGERYATSTGAAITGKHAHQILIDDNQNPQKAGSDVARLEANSYLGETLSTRKVDKVISAVIFVQQRLHEDDSTGFILEQGGRILHICLPAELSDAVRPLEWREFYVDGLLDPVRLSREVIKGLRKQLGSYAASSQLDQLPSPAEGGILKKHWFEVVDRHVPSGAVVKFKLDTAYTKKTTNDPTGFFAYFMEAGQMYVVNAEEQYMELPQLKKYLPVYCMRHGYSGKSTVKIEPKACFVAGTLVRTCKGLVAIEKIMVGDKVLSFNEGSKRPEYKKVLNTYTHPLVQREMITFVFNDFIIKCTSNHEFYINGVWAAASALAADFFNGGLGLRFRYDESVSYINGGKVNFSPENDKIRKRESYINDTRKGQVWLYAYSSDGGNANSEGASVGSANVLGEPVEFTGNEPQKFNQARQQGREFGVGDEEPEHATHGKARKERRIYKRYETKNPGHWGMQPRSNINGRSGEGDKAEIQKARLFSKKISRGVRRYLRNDFKCKAQRLEACEIGGIKNVLITEDFITVYDLCVEDNHNFCITNQNFIVHNSGIDLYNEMKSIAGLNVMQDRSPKDDKITRAHSISARVEAGKVVLLRGAWNEAFLNQVGAFPNAKHDEHVDNLCSAVLEEFQQKVYRYKRVV